MCRRLIFPACFALMLSMAGNTSAELVGYWKLDEGSGTVAADSSAYGNDGTLNGNATWVNGQIDGALDFDGSGSFVEIPHDVSLSMTDEITIAAWTYMRTGASGEMAIVSKGGWAANNLPYELTETPGDVIFWQFYDNEGRDTCAPLSPPVDEWHHIAATYDGTIFKCYIDGVLADEWAYAGKLPQNTLSVTIGRRSTGGTYFNGMLDEIMIYDHALGEDEIPGIMTGASDSGSARGPDPADGALHEDTWITLIWRAGDFAVSHDVYLGDNFDDVNDGTGDTFRGNQPLTNFMAGFPGYAYPDGLVPGTTYYWRIDEVNDSEPNSPWKGDVWSFSVPPKTAYLPDPADGAESVDPNATLSWTPGFGARVHTVYFGDNFDDVNNAADGTTIGKASFSPPALESEKVYYWRVDEFDALETHKGDIWGFTTPGAVRNPQPANGAADVQKIATLSWTAADSAASHELYFGTDADAVRDATTASPEYIGPRALAAESYDPGGLAWDSSYAWRVDEVYPDKTVKGLVWSFAAADFLLVDDFESYDDIDPAPGEPGVNRIFDKWIDGFGTTTNGALVGNDMPPYAEQGIVHGGAQSMPYRYDNTGKTSEATLTLVWPRDWTDEGVTKLSLWFRGGSANSAEGISVSLNGMSVVWHDDSAATQATGWNWWIVDLQAFAGVNMANVNSITVGIGPKPGDPAPGGTGTVYFDDIRLIR